MEENTGEKGKRNRIIDKGKRIIDGREIIVKDKQLILWLLVSRSYEF